MEIEDVKALLYMTFGKGVTYSRGMQGHRFRLTADFGLEANDDLSEWIILSRKGPLEVPMAPTYATLGQATEAVQDEMNKRRGFLSPLLARFDTARKKYPGQSHMLAALTAEVGELARALLKEDDIEKVRAKALDVAVVALRIYEEGDDDFS